MAFDYRVSQAIDIIYAKHDIKRGQEAFEMLKAAADEGDGDACFFLGRCYGGPDFADPRFNYIKDYNLTKEYFNKSIEYGSAVGMFASRRFAGFKPRCGSFVQPPYNSNREVWDAVVKLALEGELFCEYLLANACYYGDYIDLMDIDMRSFSDEHRQYILKSMTLTAMEMFEDLFTKGMIMGHYNYKDIVTSGDYGVPVSKAKVKWLKKICAKNGTNI